MADEWQSVYHGWWSQHNTGGSSRTVMAHDDVSLSPGWYEDSTAFG